MNDISFTITRLLSRGSLSVFTIHNMNRDNKNRKIFFVFSIYISLT